MADFHKLGITPLSLGKRELETNRITCRTRMLDFFQEKAGMQSGDRESLLGTLCVG